MRILGETVRFGKPIRAKAVKESADGVAAVPVPPPALFGNDISGSLSTRVSRDQGCLRSEWKRSYSSARGCEQVVCGAGIAGV